MAYEDWATLDDEALEETAAAAPESLTEQQRLLLDQYNIAQTTDSEHVTDQGIANPQESPNVTDPSEEMDWAELDEEALDEAAAAPEESLTEQQRLCLSRRIKSQPPIELEDEDEAEDEEAKAEEVEAEEVDDEAETEGEPEADAKDEDEVEVEIEDKEAWTSVPNAKTDQNVLWQEEDQQILCPWKKWIYDEDNSIAIVQGNGHIKKPSCRWDAYRPSRSSVLRADITETLKIQEVINRNPHLRSHDQHEQPTLADYSRAHLHGQRRTTCQLRGPSPLRQDLTLDMSGIKLIFDRINRINRTRNVNAWQHHENRSQPRMRSPLRQFSCAEPEEATTIDDTDIILPQPTDPIIQGMPPIQAPEKETTSEEPIATPAPPFKKYCLFRIASVLKSASKVADAVVHLIR
jgi:hypothetical protein